jgi:hypothetical protein
MKYKLVMRATDESMASMMNADFTEMLETPGLPRTSPRCTACLRCSS